MASTPDDFFSDIQKFNGEFNPHDVIRPNIDVLADGQTYDFEILEAMGDRTKTSRDPLVKLVLKVTDGAIVEYSYVLSSAVGANRLGSDLLILGFDTDKWTGQRSFSSELKAALPKLKGLKFRASKSSSVGSNGKTYHNLAIAMLIKPGTKLPPPASRPAAGKSTAPATVVDEAPF